MRAVLLLDVAIGKIDIIVSEMTNLAEKKVWIRRLGELIHIQNENLVQPIVDEFPDLDRKPP